VYMYCILYWISI